MSKQGTKSSSPQFPTQLTQLPGGDLNDMAKDGTSIPGDAGKQRTIPSVPNPRQAANSAESSAEGGLGAPNAAAAADNPTDIPRGPSDMSSANAEAITGLGDQMPGEQGSKHLHYSGANALAKGSERLDKHTRDSKSVYDEGQDTHGAGVMKVPGEEKQDPDSIKDRKQAQTQ